MVKHKREYVENDAADQSAEVEIEGGEGEGDDDNSSSQDVSEDIESESSQSSESEEDSSEEEEDEDPEDNTVNVTMAFRDPTEADFHGLKALLQTYLDGAPYSCSELVDTIIKQVSLRTTGVLLSFIVTIYQARHGMQHPQCFAKPACGRANFLCILE
jgi:hypothetical protein